MKKSAVIIFLLASLPIFAQFKNIDLSSTPAASYDFSSSMVMKTSVYSPKDQKTTTMKSKFMFGTDGNTMATKFLTSDDPSMARMSQSTDMMIFDFGQKKMFTFMNNKGSKVFMGMSIKSDGLQDYVEKENAKITITKTAETKTIAGYLCDGYLLDYSGEKMTLWVSRNKVPEIAKMAQKMGQGMMGSFGSKNASKNPMTYNAHPEMVKMANEGRMTMGYSSKGKNGEETNMELEEIKPNDKSTFNSAEYKSMMGGK